LHDVFLVEPLIGMMRMKNLSAGARSLFNLPQSGLVQQGCPAETFSVTVFVFINTKISTPNVQQTTAL